MDARSRYVTATKADPTLCLVSELLSRGCPDHKRSCPIQAKPFWSVRHQLAAADGLLLYGEHLVVPLVLRQEVMAGIHDGHFGESKCVLRARSAVYWPGCDDQIRNMVASCSICQERRHRNPTQPLYPVELPVHAFQMVSGDLFLHDGTDSCCGLLQQVAVCGAASRNFFFLDYCCVGAHLFGLRDARGLRVGQWYSVGER